MINASKSTSRTDDVILRGKPAAWAPAALLGLAFILQGAKTELAFAAWALTALACSAWLTLKNGRRLSWPTISAPIIFLVGLEATQWFSLDPNASFFWTLQWITFTLVWITFRTEDTEFSQTAFLIVLRAAGAVTAFLTIQQMIRTTVVWGWLPVNTDWNAAWMAVVAVYLLAGVASRPKDSPFWTYMDGLLAALLIGLVAMGVSRSALLGLLMGGSVLARARFHIGWRALGIAILLGLLGVLPTPWFQSRLADTFREMQQGGRLEIWWAALRSLMDHPLLGYGPGNFELAYMRHAFPVVQNPVYYDLTTAFAHNEYLQALIELGWPAGGWLLLGAVAVFKRCGMPDGHLPEKASIAALAVMALFNPTFHLPLLLLTAVLFACSIVPKAPARSAPMAQVFWLKAGLLGIIFFTAAGLFWRGVRAVWAQQQRWDRIVALCPTDAEAWHTLGERGTPEQNIESQKNAVRLSPNQPYYHEALGRALESTGRTDELAAALQAYLDASLEAPKRAINFLAIGRLLFREGDPATARPWFEKALALEPFYWEADLWTARCYFADGTAGGRERAVSILDSLERRHADFRRHFPVIRDPSAYAQAILGYDSTVVDRQRQWFLDKMRHSRVQR